MMHPPTDWSCEERRLRRSSNPTEALGYWLESSRQRAKLRNLVLANDLGLLVSGAGFEEDWNELAAWAPIATAEAGAPARSSVKLPGYPAYVCSELTEGHTLLSDVAAGCARILQSV